MAASTNGMQQDANSKVSSDTLAGRSSEEAASLLDSCESEDDDDNNNGGGDCESLAACGSEDYAEFVDVTGRVAVKETNKNAAVEFAEQYPRVAYASAPIAVDTTAAAGVNSIREPGRKSPLLNHDGVAFDLNQPWQRSLLRQMDAAAQQQQQQQQAESTPRREMMMLGHAESQDFAVSFDHDDTISLETFASSTAPSKMQLIHRTPLSMPKPRIVYHIVEDEADFREHEITSVQVKVERRRKQGRDSETSSLTSATMPLEDDRDRRDEVSFRTKATTPDQLVSAWRKDVATQRRSQSHDQSFLSTGGTGRDNSMRRHDQDPAAAAAASSSMLPDAGCFCMGYNMLDYVLPPQPPAAHVGVLRPSHLARVAEDPLPESVDVTRSTRKDHRALPRSANNTRDPQGIYFPAGVYFESSAASATTSTRRQGADF